MADNVYKVTELVGSSTESVDQAVRNAITRASSTLRNLDWFEVSEIRGHVENGQVATDLHDLEPVEVAQRPRCPIHRVADGGVDAVRRRADDLAD